MNVNSFVPRDREVAYEKNVVNLQIAWNDKIMAFADSAVSAVLGANRGRHGWEADKDTVQSEATDIVAARLLKSAQWECVSATDVNDIAYEAVNKVLDGQY